GLVTKFMKEIVCIYSSNDPNCLVAYLDQKCKRFDYYRDQMLKIVPRFREFGGEFSVNKRSVRCFVGVDAVRHSLYSSLNNSSEYLCCVLPQKENILIKDFIMNCCDVYSFNPGYKFNVVIPKNDQLSEIFTKYFLTLKNVQFLYTEDLGFTDLKEIF